MSDKLDKIVNQSRIPEQLKTYFQESNRAKEYINESMLKDIEELFIFYKSLFHFDETEFSAFTISSLKRGSEVTAYYYYLKKVLDSNLEFLSKDQTFNNSKNVFNLKSNGVNSLEMFEKISMDFGHNVNYFYNNEYEKIDVLKAYRLLGMLQLITDITGNSHYKKMCKAGEVVINRKIKEYNLQFDVKKP